MPTTSELIRQIIKDARTRDYRGDFYVTEDALFTQIEALTEVVYSTKFNDYIEGVVARAGLRNNG